MSIEMDLCLTIAGAPNIYLPKWVRTSPTRTMPRNSTHSKRKINSQKEQAVCLTSKYYLFVIQPHV